MWRRGRIGGIDPFHRALLMAGPMKNGGGSPAALAGGPSARPIPRDARLAVLGLALPAPLHDLLPETLSLWRSASPGLLNGNGDEGAGAVQAVGVISAVLPSVCALLALRGLLRLSRHPAPSKGALVLVASAWPLVAGIQAVLDAAAVALPGSFIATRFSALVAWATLDTLRRASPPADRSPLLSWLGPLTCGVFLLAAAGGALSANARLGLQTFGDVSMFVVAVVILERWRGLGAR